MAPPSWVYEAHGRQTLSSAGFQRACGLPKPLYNFEYTCTETSLGESLSGPEDKLDVTETKLPPIQAPPEHSSPTEEIANKDLQAEKPELMLPPIKQAEKTETGPMEISILLRQALIM